MAITFSVLFLVVAAVIFAIASVWGHPKVNLIAAGLFFFTLSAIATGVKLIQG